MLRRATRAAKGCFLQYRAERLFREAARRRFRTRRTAPQVHLYRCPLDQPFPCCPVPNVCRYEPEWASSAQPTKAWLWAVLKTHRSTQMQRDTYMRKQTTCAVCGRAESFIISSVFVRMIVTLRPQRTGPIGDAIDTQCRGNQSNWST